MKSQSLLLLASAGMALAHPSHDHHKRFHAIKRQDATATTIVVGSTQAVYVLNGQEISQDDVEQGIRNGTLVLDQGAAIPAPQPSSAAASVPASSATVQVQTQPTTAPASSAAASSAPASSSAAAPSKAPEANKAIQKAVQTSSSDSSSSGSPSSYNTGNGNTDTDFPDGTIDCSSFPSSYGAVAIDYMNLGGWIGIQKPGSTSDAGYSDISSASSCVEGAFCSYACPPGYQKSQWPSLQGATGQSVGGVKCSGGKLHLTNTQFQQLCIPGAAEVSVGVVNKLSQSVAICRTDYPGTESETVPIGLAAGGNSTLACPDASSYYKWTGKSTSAQYYVNPAGSVPSTACQWGNPGTPLGNYAPLNLGVGFSNGAAWLSIMQNAPTTDAKLQYKVSIVAGSGTTLGGSCYYANGAYHGQGNDANGCTVSVPSGGSAYYVFEDA